MWPSSRGRRPVQIEVPRRRPPGIRLTPLIDVVFILLVFFMLASSFLDWRAFELALPPADATPDPEASPIVVRIGPQGGYSLAGEDVAPSELAQRVGALQADEPGRPVVIRASDATPADATVSTLDRLRKGGVESVSLAAGAP